MSQQEQYLTVKALTQYIKRKFDYDPYLGKVYVVGEVSNFRLRPNGHQYFSLKEENVKINVAMFKTAFAKLPFELEEGMKVYAIGRISVYEPSGTYQMTIESLQPDGIGALYLALEQLKQKLTNEGVLAIPKKTPVSFPKRIAVITSPSGAVIQDICTTLKRRYPIAQIVVFPTRVQGKEAVAEIVDAFARLQKRIAQFDTVILARGGGSIEDLWCFNDEAVARAIIACPLPVITAIGHETDTTIADLVGDLRAPTPTAAAEMAAPELSQVYQYLAKQQLQLQRLLEQQLKHYRTQLNRIEQSYVLQQPARLYQAYMQQLDYIAERFKQASQRYIEQQKRQLERYDRQVIAYSPHYQLQLAQQQLQQKMQQLQLHILGTMHSGQQQLQQYAGLLEAYSPLKSLSRGYAIVTDNSTGQVIKRVDQLQPQQIVSLQLTDGMAQAQIQTTKVADLDKNK